MNDLRPFNLAWKRRALAGEVAAVSQLVDQCLEPLYQFCLYRVGRDRHCCEEVVQETLLKAIGELNSYDPQRSEGRIFPWLAGLARNQIRKAAAARPSELSLEAVWARMDQELRDILGAIDSTRLADEVLRREETREMVNAAMSQLPPHYREALESKYLRQLSVRDIARQAQSTEKAVESLLVRARQAFRQTFLALARSLNTEVFPS